MPELPSISSSGYNDGLGRREIAFDRETGTLLERLYVRPEIGVFDTAIAGRVDKLQSLVDERFARPVAVERDRGRVVVVSEYVAGVRIGDLLETPETLQDAPTLDLALGFLLEALPALDTFHTTTGMPHGLVASGRTVLASSPRVVFLDSAFGDVLARLHYSRSRLWRELGLAMPESAGPSRATVASDIGQAAVIALMLVLGRSILDDEYPHAVPALVSEVSDVALIRGSEKFATALRHFLETALPLSSQSYGAANEALADVRRIVDLEMGADACGRALATFVEQIDVGAQPLPSAVLDTIPSIEVVGLDDEPAEEFPAANVADAEETPLTLDSTPEPLADASIAFTVVTEGPADLDLPVKDDISSFAPIETPAADLPAPVFDEPEPVASFAPAIAEEPAAVEPAPATPEKSVDDPWSFRPGASERATPPVEEPVEEPAEEAVSSGAPFLVTQPFNERTPSGEEPPLAAEPAEPAPAIEPAAAAEEEEAEPSRSFFSPRRKRGEKSRSARARKDKLRSAAAAFKDSVIARVTHQNEPGAAQPGRDADARPSETPRTPDVPRAAEPPRHVEPAPEPPLLPRPKPHIAPITPASRATSFEPPAAEAAPPPAPRPFASPLPPVAPPQPVFEPPPSPPMPTFTAPPIALSPPTPPAAPAPIQLQGAPPISLSPSAPPAQAASSAPTLKLKTPVAPPRRERFEPPPADFPDFPRAADPGPREFPWKLAAAAVVIILAGVVAGRAYIMPDRKVEEQRIAREAAEYAKNTQLPPAKRGGASIATGKLVIETDQPGARVLLGTEFIGQTPLTIEKPPGKYTLTVSAGAASATRTVRIEAGKTLPLNVALTSGWVAIFAPITFEVYEKGRFVANTEDGRLLLLPGRHELTLTNKALGYSAVHTVEVQSTEVVPLTIEPKGRANFNAAPGWAEVWLEDKKLGETPLSQELPLGVHNFLFKHPDFGERKVSATIRADQPAAVSVDFNK